MGVEAVADAGPLIHLGEVDALPALGVFERLHIPDAVWEEVVLAGRLRVEQLSGMRNLNRHSPAQSEIDELAIRHGLTSLQAGELACLCLCTRHKLKLLLTGDMAARSAAERLGITPVGSLGVVVRAFREGLFTRQVARQCLLDLQDVSSLFVTRAIVEMAIERLG